MPNLQDQIAVVRGPDKGTVWSLTATDDHTIGRGPDNTIVLTDNTVSNYHAALQFEDGVWFIVDVGSKHGTWLNDKRVEPRKPLFNKDIIRIGKSYLVYGEGETGKPRKAKVEEG